MVPTVTNLRITDQTRQAWPGRDRAFQRGGSRNLSMGRHRTDGDVTALDCDAGEFGQRGEVDQRARRCEPLLHGRQQGHAAG